MSGNSQVGTRQIYELGDQRNVPGISRNDHKNPHHGQKNAPDLPRLQSVHERE